MVPCCSSSDRINTAIIAVSYLTDMSFQTLLFSSKSHVILYNLRKKVIGSLFKFFCTLTQNSNFHSSRQDFKIW